VQKSLFAPEQRFLGLGMAPEAAQILLDFVEICVRRKQWQDAVDIAARALQAFRAMDAPVHAANALAYLNEAVVSRCASADLVTSISAYVSFRIASVFTPPPMNRETNGRCAVSFPRHCGRRSIPPLQCRAFDEKGALQHEDIVAGGRKLLPLSLLSGSASCGGRNEQ
jgi:hypothetical protein